MKGKAGTFVSSFALYCLIFLTWNSWNVTGKQIAEMIFIGILLGLFNALAMNRIKRFIGNIVRKIAT